MIGLATLSLLAACPHSAEGLPAAQSPPQNAAGSESGGAGADTIVSLPRQAGPWVRPDAPRRITEETIFDYMDGAGELYLAYRFEHLDVYQYAAPEKRLGTIKVELYWMGSPDDAFGLLSNDWGGEAIDLRGQGEGRHPHPAVPSHDALYGGGLLRFWSDNLYGRVMASRESPESRAAGAGNRQVDRQRADLEWSAAGDPVEDPGPVGRAPRPAARPNLLLPVALRAQLGVLPCAE